MPAEGAALHHEISIAWSSLETPQPFAFEIEDLPPC